MQLPPGCEISLRARRLVQDPDAFARYVLGRAVTAGFPVTPARAENIAQVLRASSQDGLTPDEAYYLYRDLFKSFLVQDPDRGKEFDRFWDELWLYCAPKTSGGGRGYIGSVGEDLADRISQALSGQIGIPVEVLLK